MTEIAIGSETEVSTVGSPLYQRLIANSDDQLMREVWGGTPFMCGAYTGSIADDRDREISRWCLSEFGPEASPLHGIPGRWHRGSATVLGWTWMGFDTELAMEQFLARWPAPVLP